MNHSDFIASAALVVAILAMTATFWQAHVARAHNRVSVRPHLDWGTGKYPDTPVILYLFNNGLGPAIIDSLTLTLDGKRFPIENFELPPEIYDEAMKVNGFIKWNLFSKGTPIANGTQIDLLIFENSPNSIASHNEAIKLLNRIGLEVRYSSMYKEKFSLNKS